MKDPILSVENLAVSFTTWGTHTYALRGINFDLKEGEILGIVGESGCGKSVTAKSIMRLLPPHTGLIEHGQILYREQNLLNLPEPLMQAVRGKEIAMIFQDPLTSLNPTKRIGAQISESVFLHHPELRKSDIEAKVIELLRLVGIAHPEERLRAYPHTLSGGIRQRAMIALAMACDPKILLADEPTTALDVTTQAQILELLKHIAITQKTSIILITHDLSVVAGLCDRVLVMYAGKIVEEASVNELFYQPRHPYTQRLLHSIPRIDTPCGIPLIPIQGRPPTLQHRTQGCAFAPRCHKAMNICPLQEPFISDISPGHRVSCWQQIKDASNE
ncbi:MAG: ABC transporter ATP-binding protein [Simkania sp.]|nr:ABC transporter ATP-binding protein [Simkania sp.]